MSSRFLKLLIFAIRNHKLTCTANNATVLLQIIWAPCNNITQLQQSVTQLLLRTRYCGATSGWHAFCV